MNRSKISAYIELSKPSISKLVLVTTLLGFYLGDPGFTQISKLIFTLIGTLLSSGGAGALNHYLERNIDKLMKRTQNRPLPMGEIAPINSLLFGLALVISGVLILAWKVNLACSILALMTAALYVLVYTPLKQYTWWNTFVGAIPGAIPPLGAWVAATGHFGLGGWILFAILFVWQHPHFYAIAWMYKEDYARGGLKMLPVVEPDGKSTFRQINLYLVALLPISILPTVIGLSNWLYLSGALISGLLLLYSGIELSQSKSVASARILLRSTVFYLPVLFLFLVADKMLLP